MVGSIVLTLIHKDKKKQQNIMLQNLRIADLKYKINVRLIKPKK